MRKIPGYRLEHFFGDEPIYASQFVALTKLIRQELKEEQKAYKKANKKGRRK